jgi:hypothetical protein
MEPVGPWAEIAELARRAPTPHNTQPFRIRPRDATSAELVLLCERLLPREDHGNLYMGSTAGVFMGAVERAGAHLGQRVTCEALAGFEPGPLERTDGARCFGHAKITGTMLPVAQPELVELRRTSRLPYEDRLVEAEIIELMHAALGVYGQRLIVVSEQDVVSRTLERNIEAVLENLTIDIERREIEGWYRYGPTPEHGDGLWEKPMNQPAWESRLAFLTPRAFGWPGLREFAVRRYLRTQAGTRHIGLIMAPFSAWPDLVRAGRGLLELWLVMARHGVYMQPFGSMLTNPKYARGVAEDFGVDDCWLLFRFGYSEAPPRSPRLESILLDA